MRNCVLSTSLERRIISEELSLADGSHKPQARREYYMRRVRAAEATMYSP